MGEIWEVCFKMLIYISFAFIPSLPSTSSSKQKFLSLGRNAAWPARSPGFCFPKSNPQRQCLRGEAGGRGPSPGWKEPPWAVSPGRSEADPSVWRCPGKPSDPREVKACLGHLGTWEPGLGMDILCGWEGERRVKTQRGHGSGTMGLSLSPAGVHGSPSPRT